MPRRFSNLILLCAFVLKNLFCWNCKHKRKLVCALLCQNRVSSVIKIILGASNDISRILWHCRWTNHNASKRADDRINALLQQKQNKRFLLVLWFSMMISSLFLTFHSCDAHSACAIMQCNCAVQVVSCTCVYPTYVVNLLHSQLWPCTNEHNLQNLSHIHIAS